MLRQFTRWKFCWVVVAAFAALLLLPGCGGTWRVDTPDKVARGHFAEPLVAFGKPTAQENAELTEALRTYLAESAVQPEKMESLEAFLASHPDSPWSASLQLNLALRNHELGRFSRALNGLKSCWEKLRDSQDVRGRALADRAAGELAVTYAYLGRQEDLEPLLAELRKRPVGGSATERVLASAEGLYQMKTSPGTSFQCGPAALCRILRPEELKQKKVHHLLTQIHSTRRGTSLTQLWRLTQQAGLNYQMAFRQPGSPVLERAVCHFKVGHFGALLSKAGQRYPIEDPTYHDFGTRVSASPSTVDEEASGYFLVAAQPLPSGWRRVGPAEGDTCWAVAPPAPRIHGQLRSVISRFLEAVPVERAAG